MKAYESARLSLADFRVRNRTVSGRKSRTDDAYVIATVLWYFRLRHRAGVNAPYGLEALIEPKTIGKNRDGERFHSSKWSRYRSGRTVPRTVLPAVEAMFPRANVLLTIPLWDALTARLLKQRQLEELVERLPRPVRWVVYDHLGEWRRGIEPLHQIDKRTAVALERRASLDALTAEILLLRLAHADGCSESAFEWGRRVQRMILLVYSELIGGGIAQALIDLVNERIMPMARHEGLQFGYPSGMYRQLIGVLTHALWHIRDRPYEDMEGTERKLVAHQILEGRYGYDLLYALNPIRAAAEVSGVAAHEQFFATPDIWLFKWAHNMLTVGGHRLPPVLDVHTGKDLWATRQGSLDPARHSPAPEAQQSGSSKRSLPDEAANS